MFNYATFSLYIYIFFCKLCMYILYIYIYNFVVTSETVGTSGGRAVSLVVVPATTNLAHLLCLVLLTLVLCFVYLTGIKLTATNTIVMISYRIHEKRVNDYLTKMQDIHHFLNLLVIFCHI